MRHKKFDEAVRQLEEEGLIQVFIPKTGVRHPIVGVVGALQLDVVSARLESEYGIQCSVEPLSHVAARWPVPNDETSPDLVLPGSGVLIGSCGRHSTPSLSVADRAIRIADDPGYTTPRPRPLPRGCHDDR